jgi:hypothetical protein
LAWCTLYQQSFFANLAKKANQYLCILLYKDKRDANAQTLANLLAFVGLLLLAYGFWRINKDLIYPGKWALVPVVGAILLLMAGPKAWINHALLSNKVFVGIGLISYPLYLWHWPLLSFARIIEGEVLSLKIRIATLSLSILLAWLTYRIVERPLRFGQYSKVKVAILAMLMTCIGYIGWNTYVREGLGFRFSKVIQEINDYKYEYKLAYRHGTCFLEDTQTYKNFTNCNSKNLGEKSTVLIWGDSHAAHLYPGIKKRYESSSNIAQYSASACPPLLNFDPPTHIHCKDINNFVMNIIRIEQPDTVMLSAFWTNYDLSELDGTISSLKKAKIKNIVVIGPVPQWKDGLQKQLITHFNKSFPHVIPERMATGLDQKFIQVDEFLKNKFKTSTVNYVSAREILCDAAGCITKIGRGVDKLVTWDHGHLTDAGSDFLVAKFPNF